MKGYEVGYKGSAFDRRLTWALAGFYADYEDVQVPGSVGCVINGVQSFCGITTNAAKARIKGVELETTAQVLRDFAGQGSSLSVLGTLRLYRRQLPYVHRSRPGVDVANVRVFQNTPDWTLSATPTLVVPVGPGTVTANSTVSYRSLTHQFEFASPFLDQPGYTLLDAGITYAFGNDQRYSIGVYGKNLTDKRYKTSGYQYINSTIGGVPILNAAGGYTATLGKEGIATAFYGNPRQVFGTFTAKF